MHIISQDLPQGVVEHMREGVIGQDTLPPLLIPFAHNLVPYLEGAISLADMQHIPSRYLQNTTYNQQAAGASTCSFLQLTCGNSPKLAA